MKCSWISIARYALGFSLLTSGDVGASDHNAHTLPVRELHTASFLDNSYAFKLLKIRGYSVDVRVAGQKRQTLKLGDTLRPPNAECTIVFKKISPETRIARFVTDCPRDGVVAN